MKARAAIATVLFGFILAACSPEIEASRSLTTAPSTTSAPPPAVNPVSTPSVTPAAPVAPDPFEQYAALIGPLEPALTKQQLREKYDTAVKMFCPGGREQMVGLKKLASNPPGAPAGQTKTANEKAAKSLGALWEFGCGKGHDAELYTPLAGATAGKKAPWLCEPGYPNCTKADSERYKAQLEYKKSTEVRDAKGETREEYCKRTGQPLATCQAG